MPNFPHKDALPGTSPIFKPEAWAVRYTALDPQTYSYGTGREDEWRKYPNRKAVNLGIKGMSHFPPHAQVVRNGEQTWMLTRMRVEVWQWLYGQWVLMETQVHRQNEETGKIEVFCVAHYVG